jgi:hypothetical protein
MSQSETHKHHINDSHPQSMYALHQSQHRKHGVTGKRKVKLKL